MVRWGQQASVSAPSFGHRLSADLSAQLIMYPRCGHFPMIEAKQASNTALAGFLREGVTHRRARGATFFLRLVRAISERGARRRRQLKDGSAPRVECCCS